jgi:hypothetical protein
MITLRYAEQDRYDIVNDAEVTRFMAISNKGTWHMEQACTKPGEKRAKRNLLKEFVENAAAKGQAPCEVRL